MNRARNDDGSYDGWCHDDQALPPSLGVWPLGRTYVHSSDGALSTGPAANGHGRPSASGSGPSAGGGRQAPAPAGRPALQPVDGGYRGDQWPAGASFGGADHIAVPPFTGATGNGSSPPYGRAAAPRYGRPAAPAPADPSPPRSGRPPLYQVGGKYRGDDWPTDPGFRRGDLGLDDDEPAADPGARSDFGPDPLAGRSDLGWPDAGHRAGRFGPSFGGPRPGYGDPRQAVPGGRPGTAWGRRALVGWIAGIIATIVYDGLRLSLVKVGIWGDPIPGIGRLVFADSHAGFAWGDLWRFMGNGGGMGIAYSMLPWRGVRSGIAYGTLICSGLFALLFFVPAAQAHLFPLTPLTAAGGMAGHWVYGAVLGKVTSWWLPPVELGRIHGRLTARLIHPGHRPRPAHARSAGDSRRAAARRSASGGR